jgi:hypothetical protein
LFEASNITVLTVGLGVYGNANPGNAIEGELITTVVEEALISPTKLNAPLILVEPVIVWSPTNIFEPVVANTEDAVPFNNLEFKAKDAVIANELLNAYDALVAFIANEAVTAWDDDAAQEDVPINDPVKDPVNEVTIKLPVISYEPVNNLELVQTEPDLINKSPYEEEVVLSNTSCNSPNSYPLSTLT